MESVLAYSHRARIDDHVEECSQSRLTENASNYALLPEIALGSKVPDSRSNYPAADPLKSQYIKRKIGSTKNA